MKVLFLGTCACDYSPKLNNEFKDKFDFDARRSSCVLINGKVLVDCGDHTLDSLRIANADMSVITDIFITHFHGDHFRINNIRHIASLVKGKLRLWIREDAQVPEIENVEIIKMESVKSYDMKNGMTVTSYRANHGEKTFPQHFLFESGGKKFFYGLDGAWILFETYYALKNAGIDCIVLDGTCGDTVGEWRIAEHNSIPMIKLMLPSFKSWGIINEKTEVYISHIAPSLHKPHRQIVNDLKDYDIKVAYDGLELTL